jgi:hypothetical protein
MLLDKNILKNEQEIIYDKITEIYNKWRTAEYKKLILNSQLPPIPWLQK